MTTDVRHLFYGDDKEFSRTEDKLYAREKLIVNVTEDLLILLEDMGISKAELARRLGKSKSFATQILAGSRNMTLGSLSDICFVLGVTPKINIFSEEQIRANAERDRQANFTREKCEILQKQIEQMFRRGSGGSTGKMRKRSWVAECVNDENYTSAHLESGRQAYVTLCHPSA